MNDGYQIARINLTGWKAVVAGVSLVMVALACVVNLWGMPSEDQKLIDSIKTQIKMYHMSVFTAEVKKYLEAGDAKKAAEAGTQIAGLKVDIASIKVAYPIISHFSKNKNVVAKVEYNVNVNGVVRETGIEYFEMRYTLLSDSWFCYGKTSKFFYYINIDSDGE